MELRLWKKYQRCQDWVNIARKDIPIDHVIINTLHLFLRISDTLINLLIRDIQALDIAKKDPPKF